MSTFRLRVLLILVIILVGVGASLIEPRFSPTLADDGNRLLTVDHYVPVHSTVPSISGQIAEIYVRERLHPSSILRSASVSGRVVLFVHGAGTPAEVSFDVPYQDYSWMNYLAEAGFDVFAMDTTGYGRSTRPAAMNDPCNLSKEQQATLIPALLTAPCSPSYPHQLTTIASDWNDIGAAVDYIRALRHVDQVSLIAWSLGGPRAGGYAAQHPEKVQRLVLLAPAYNRKFSTSAPEQLPAEGRGHEHAITQRVHCKLGPPGGLRKSIRSRSERKRVVGNDAVGSGWSHVGSGRAEGAAM